MKKMAMRTYLIVLAVAAGIAFPAVAVDWKPGHNATREGDIIIVDAQGKRDGGAAHAKLDLGGMTGGIRATIRERFCDNIHIIYMV